MCLSLELDTAVDCIYNKLAELAKFVHACYPPTTMPYLRILEEYVQNTPRLRGLESCRKAYRATIFYYLKNTVGAAPVEEVAVKLAQRPVMCECIICTPLYTFIHGLKAFAVTLRTTSRNDEAHLASQIRLSAPELKIVLNRLPGQSSAFILTKPYMGKMKEWRTKYMAAKKELEKMCPFDVLKEILGPDFEEFLSGRVTSWPSPEGPSMSAAEAIAPVNVPAQDTVPATLPAPASLTESSLAASVTPAKSLTQPSHPVMMPATIAHDQSKDVKPILPPATPRAPESLPILTPLRQATAPALTSLRAADPKRPASSPATPSRFLKLSPPLSTPGSFASGSKRKWEQIEVIDLSDV